MYRPARLRRGIKPVARGYSDSLLTWLLHIARREGHGRLRRYRRQRAVGSPVACGGFATGRFRRRRATGRVLHSEDVSSMTGATPNLGYCTNQQGDGNNKAAGNHDDSSFVFWYPGNAGKLPCQTAILSCRARSGIVAACDDAKVCAVSGAFQQRSRRSRNFLTSVGRVLPAR